jgi:predicted RNA methylase
MSAAVLLFKSRPLPGPSFLIDKEVPVAGHTRGAQYVAPHTAIRHVRPESQAKSQLDLFAPLAPAALAESRTPDSVSAPESVLPPSPAAAPTTGEQLLVDEHKALANALEARKAGAKLRAAGAKLTEEAERDISRDRMTNTAKRARQASTALSDAARKVEMGRTLGRLADALEAGTVPHLARVSTRAAVEDLESTLRQAMYAAERGSGRPLGHRTTPELGDIAFAAVPRLRAWRELIVSITRQLGEREGHAGLIDRLEALPATDDHTADMPEDLARETIAALDTIGEHHDGWQWRDTLAQLGRWRRIGIETDADLHAALTNYLGVRSAPELPDPVKQMERDLVGKQVGIDFFPTPPGLVARMLRSARIVAGDRVLEPSAGKGDIADAARAAGASVDAIEISDTLRKLLEAKGHHLVAQDFEDFTPTEPYDTVIMNPPWSGNADVRHTRRAYDLVKPGGTVVSLIGMHSSFASDRVSREFRDWLEELGAEVEDQPREAFVSQWQRNGIPSRLVVLHKPQPAVSRETPSGLPPQAVPPEAKVSDAWAGYRDASADSARASLKVYDALGKLYGDDSVAELKRLARAELGDAEAVTKGYSTIELALDELCRVADGTLPVGASMLAKAFPDQIGGMVTAMRHMLHLSGSARPWWGDVPQAAPPAPLAVEAPAMQPEGPIDEAGLLLAKSSSVISLDDLVRLSGKSEALVCDYLFASDRYQMVDADGRQWRLHTPGGKSANDTSTP